MNPDLPTHLISKILFHADLEIDTRRALRMRPGPVKRLISNNARQFVPEAIEFMGQNLFRDFSTRTRIRKKKT
jgi:hypothetical protein